VKVFYSDKFLLHEPPEGVYHPERPERLRLALEGVGKARVGELVEPCEGRVEAFLEVHDESYYQRVVESAKHGPSWLDPDTYIVPGTLEALQRLACAVDMAVEEAETGARALILGRPPGHHAGRSGTGLGAPTLGFCIFNASALVAVRLSRKGRVAVLDFDAHHGNGTQDILWDLNILHVDIHQDSATIYPGTGFPGQTGGVKGTKANINLPPGSRDDIGLDAISYAGRLVSEWDPDYIVVSAGFDGMSGDNYMVSLMLGEAFYNEAGRILSRLGVPVVVVLEGGYERGLIDGLSAFLEGLHGRGGYRPGGESDSRAWSWYRRRIAELEEALGRS